MKYFKWLLSLIICISSFMIYTNNVKADSYDSFYITNYSFSGSGSVESPTINYGFINGLWKPSSFYNRMTINFNNISTNNYDYFLLNFSTFNENYDVYTCSNEYVSGNEIADINFSTGYADGSTSQNSGTIEFSNASGMLRYCNAWKSTGQYYTLFISYNVNNSTYSCQTILDKNGSSYALCPIPKNINSFSLNNINFDTSFLQTKQNYYFKISQNIWFIKSNSSTLNSINNNTNEIKNDIKDSSIDNNNASSSANNWANKNATNGTITNLLTLPISLLQNILNGIQTTCSNFSLGTLFGTELVLPCIDLSSLIGSTLFGVIDLLFSGFMILNISKKLIKIFNDFTNLKSNQIDEIYSNGGGAS